MQTVCETKISLTCHSFKNSETEAGKAFSGRLERPPCKFRPSAMLVPSVLIACAERAECLFRTRGMLVRSAGKPCFGLPEGFWRRQSGFWEPESGCFLPSEAVFLSLSNVRISLSTCHAAFYRIPPPFFPCRPEGGAE